MHFLLMKSDNMFINKTKRVLNSTFEIKDLGHVRYLLGMEVTKKKDGYFLNQQKYILDLIQINEMKNAMEVETLLKPNKKLSKFEGKLIAKKES